MGSLSEWLRHVPTKTDETKALLNWINLISLYAPALPGTSISTGTIKNSMIDDLRYFSLSFFCNSAAGRSSKMVGWTVGESGALNPLELELQ